MTSLTGEQLKQMPIDDWRELYLSQGSAMLALATECLTNGPFELGLDIVSEALFEEDIENPDAKRILSDLDFKPLGEPLSKLLQKEEFSVRALYALWVCCQEGAALQLEPSRLEPWLDKAHAKSKIKGVSARALAFRILLHVFAQQKQSGRLTDYLKGNSDLKKVLFEELSSRPCAAYDLSPFLEMLKKNLQAKGESSVREAISLLLALMKSGCDISATIPFIFAEQKRLIMFTDAAQLLAGYFLKTGKYGEFIQWLSDPDPKISINGVRGLTMANRSGIAGDEFLKQPGVISLLRRHQ